MNRPGTPPLPQPFLDRPIAHRGFHDVAVGRPENSRASLRAAIAAHYPVELDVQLSADGVAMVFHDYDLARLAGTSGPIRQRKAAELVAMPLLGGPSSAPETIPTLEQFLDLCAGQVPLLIEIKDQDGAMGPGIGPLEAAVAAALRDYGGDAAVMSFNPYSVAAMARLAPDRPRGLTTAAFRALNWLTLSAATRARLRRIEDPAAIGAAFISHEAADLGRDRIAALKSAGYPVLCWTIRDPAAEAAARRIADNVTFEGYDA